MPKEIVSGIWSLVSGLRNIKYIKKTAFTLIELLVVVTILAIIGGLALTSYDAARDKGSDTRRKKDLLAISEALEAYYLDKGFYPATSSNSLNSNWLPELTSGGYLNEDPKDPRQISFLGNLANLININPSSSPRENSEPEVAGIQTLNLQVASGADDAAQRSDGNNFSNNSGTIIMQAGPAPQQYGGFRFNNIVIPQGATITNAYMEFKSPNIIFDDFYIEFRAEAADNAQDFVTNPTITGRSYTAEKQTWTLDAAGTAFVSTNQLKTIIQEVVNRPSWDSGNSIVIVAKGLDQAQQKLGGTQSFESNPANTPKLNITFDDSIPQRDSIPPWNFQDLGATKPGGQIGSSAVAFQLTGDGQDIWSSIVEGRIAWQQVSGSQDFSIEAKVNSLTKPYNPGWSMSDWAKAGVIIMDGLNNTSPYAFAFGTPVNGSSFEYRLNPGWGTGSTNNGTINVPEWYKIEKAGNQYTASNSEDGINWNPIGTQTINMGSTLYVGVFATSHDFWRSNLLTADFSNIALSIIVPPSPTPSPTPTPTPPPPECADGINNDPLEDLLIDLADPGCIDANDDDESDPPPSGITGIDKISYVYEALGGTSYRLWAHLDNEKDPEIVGMNSTNKRCSYTGPPPSPIYNYCIEPLN